MKLVLLVAFAVLVPFAGAQKKQLQAGLWEMTTHMEMEGSGIQMPPMTMKKCITHEQTENPADLFRPKQPGRDNCDMKVVKKEAGTLTWTVDCKEKGKGSGTVTFEAERYTVNSQMEMIDKNGVKRQMKSTMTAHRVGECPAQ
jgi:Protein of unknown function (DUF3617)